MLQIFKMITKGFINGDTKIFEFIRFGVVGIIATGLHYGLYIVLLHQINPNVAYTLGYGFSFLMNFFLSSFFTFKTKPSFKKGIGFGISHGINYLLHMLLLNFFLWLKIREQLAPIPVFAIVIPVNFFLVRTVLKSKKNIVT
jgi:putative flippase GtrA